MAAAVATSNTINPTTVSNTSLAVRYSFSCADYLSAVAVFPSYYPDDSVFCDYNMTDFSVKFISEKFSPGFIVIGVF
jgi:hypothetical protein